MLQALKIFPILKGFRGQAGVDLRALTAALVNLSRLVVDYPEIRELDLNPVVATPLGCWCVDCRIVQGD
jgi:acetyltransferase